MAEPLNIKTIRDKMLEAMEDPNVNTRDMATVFRRFNTKAGECKNAPAASCKLDEFVSKAVVPVNYSDYGEDYDRLLAIQEGKAAEVFPAVAATPEPAPEAAPEPAPESALSKREKVEIKRSGSAGVGEPEEDEEEEEDDGTSASSGSRFAGQAFFGLTGPAGLTVPGGNNTPQSESSSVMTQIGGEVGLRNGPVGAFVHGSLAMSRTSSPNSAGEGSYDIEEGNTGDTYGLAVKARIAAQLRLKVSEEFEPLAELGGVYAYADGIQQGLIRDTTISNKAPYFALGTAYLLSENAAVVAKLYGDGHAGTQRTSPSGGAPRRSGLGGNDAFNLSGGLFVEGRF